MKEYVVQLSMGQVKLKKPKAGVRNKALMKSETGEGMKQTTFLVELMPYCIAEHPWGTVPIREALDDLEVEEYDKLIDSLNKLFEVDDETTKKLKEPSGQGDSQ